MFMVPFILFLALFSYVASAHPLLLAAQDDRRVVGQPTSPEDMQAWSKIREAADVKKKFELAKEYLEEHANGGYVPFAHQILAVHYRLRNDVEKFIEHSEEALKDLPNDPVLLSSLSAEYAEQQQPEIAIARGERALQALNADSADLEGKARLQSDAHFGIGTGYLFQAYNKKGEAKLMELALQHLQQAIVLDPHNGLAHFRLAFAYQMKEEPGQAVLSYARAAACPGSVSATARQYLEAAYKAMHGSTQGMEKILEEQKAYLQEQLQKLPSQP